MSELPSRNAEEYPAMWAYGNHYRCLPEDETITYETFDSAVFVISPQGCRASPQDMNIVDADLPYIGFLKKIVAVTYCTIPMNVMKCSWIRPNLARSPSIRQDEHGFWMVKPIARQDPLRENPYVFPYSVSQVRCFSRNPLFLCELHASRACTLCSFPMLTFICSTDGHQRLHTIVIYRWTMHNV